MRRAPPPPPVSSADLELLVAAPSRKQSSLQDRLTSHYYEAAGADFSPIAVYTPSAGNCIRQLCENTQYRSIELNCFISIKYTKFDGASVGGKSRSRPLDKP